MAGDEGRPGWDEAEAEAVAGSRVLLGLTYAAPEGDRHEQAYGRVTRADQSGITIELDGRRAGERFHLPPDLRSFQRAPPGDYRLRSTGEVVTDPDYVCTWTIHPPPG